MPPVLSFSFSVPGGLSWGKRSRSSPRFVSFASELSENLRNAEVGSEEMFDSCCQSLEEVHEKLPGV
jgi:hypothetical protein